MTPSPRLDPAAAASSVTIRVRFCETDLMGIVHHANYLAYFEVGRVEWLRRRQVAYRDWAKGGIHLPVVEVSLRYRLPARFDDLLTVESRLGDLRRASLRFDYRILRAGTLLAEGMTRLACVDGANAVRRLEPDMIAALCAAEAPPPEPSPAPA